MKSIEILQKIIDNEGKCDFSTPKICAQCPMSKLKNQDSGSFMGCIEAVGIVGLCEKDADEKYLLTAKKKMADIKIEEILEEDDVFID